jgi:sugar fermentation stimulation protein A
MHFSAPLVEGRLIKRYKRFLADVELVDGAVITAHTANTGAMLGCAAPGSRVWLSRSDNPKRRCPYTWELVETPEKVLVGINTQLSNGLVREAIEAGVVAELTGYDTIRGEVRYGQEKSRIDLLLEGKAPPCYVEVKNVTLAEDGQGFFPDAVTTRGAKHLRELMHVVQEGGRALIFFCVQREDVERFRPADHIDPVYGATLREALDAGVEALAYGAQLSPQAIVLHKALPVSI